nr:O-acetyl-ADP-ribose deacetylase MACROD2 isoform X1 [Meriones unguiculatus]
MYPSNKKKKVWREEKERLLKMTLEERRKEYLRDYVPLSTILSWKEEMKSKGQNDGCIPNGWRNGGEWKREPADPCQRQVMERKSYSWAIGNEAFDLISSCSQF